MTRPVSRLVHAMVLGCLVLGTLQAEVQDGGLTFMTIADGEFKLGDRKYEWSEADRAEVDWRFIMADSDDREVFGNGYVFWEDRSWEADESSIDQDAWGFGIGGGGIFHLIGKDRNAPLKLSVMPYGRLGVGFQDLTVEQADIGDSDLADDDISPYRFELALGADLRAVLADRISVGFGPQLLFWRSRDVVVATINEDDVEFDQTITFRGTDIWMRLALGIVF